MSIKIFFISFCILVRCLWFSSSAQFDHAFDLFMLGALLSQMTLGAPFNFRCLTDLLVVASIHLIIVYTPACAYTFSLRHLLMSMPAR